jgi:arabinogalactan oligomer/maltooligosaccharide transport system permease protein
MSVNKRRFLIGLFAGLLLGTVLQHLFLGEILKEENAMRNQRTGIVTLQALTQLLEQVSSAEGDLQKAVTIAARGEPTARDIRVVRKITLEASTLSSDQPVPRRLKRDEKPVFDQAQRLRAAVQTNREEGVSRKEEIELSQAAGGGLSLAGPLEVDQTIEGMVQLDTKPGPSAKSPGWFLPAAVVLALTLLFFGLTFVLPDRLLPMALVSGALLLVGLVGYGLFLRSAARQQMRESEQKVADFAAHEKSLAADIAEELHVRVRLQPDRWDTDVFRRPRGIMDSNGQLIQGRLQQRISGSLHELRNIVWGIWALAIALFAVIGFGLVARLWGAIIHYREAYAYTLPAMLGMLVLVFFPFFYGIALSFTDSNLYNTNKSILDIWVGFRNYKEILGDFSFLRHTSGGWIANYANFYWTLLFNIVWTITNVLLGVTVGLILALILNTKGLAIKPIYRVLLILPWAMPNYITALIWKGMFHQQFGVINQVLQIFGAHPVAWFERPLTSFLTVLATNGWLSFPFMMVVSLGALQSIPAELYEAARVDGATRWQQFRSITLPSLKPALVPAIILSVIWTFNQFNIIYLVSQGEPAGSTEILITEAYKIAFEKYRYGYAAAYSTVIFMILLVYGSFQNRVTRATEGI